MVVSSRVWYVYEMKIANEKVFYVGKSDNPEGRFKKHLYEASIGVKTHKCNTIRKAWAAGKKIELDVVYQTDVEELALAEEGRLVAWHREHGTLLTNATGCNVRRPEHHRTHMRGHGQKYSADVIQKRAQSLKSTLASKRMHEYDHVHVKKLEAGLCILHSIQEKVSGQVPGAIPQDDEPPGLDMISTAAFALIAEVCEAASEMNWKPWKKEKEVNSERLLDETADILAFIGQWLVLVSRQTGCTMEDIARAYEAKTAVNLDRIAGNVPGYGIEKEPPDEATHDGPQAEDQPGADGEEQEPGHQGEDLPEPAGAVGPDPGQRGGVGAPQGRSWPVWPADQLKLL